LSLYGPVREEFWDDGKDILTAQKHSGRLGFASLTVKMVKRQ
jgi:hypothetical protein